MSGIYCVKCHAKTPTVGAHPEMSHGRKRVVGKCARCGCKKCQFVKSGAGFFGDLAKKAAKTFGPAAIDALSGLAKDKLGKTKYGSVINNLGLLDAAGDAAKGGLSGLGIRRRHAGRIRVPGMGARKMVMRY